MPTKTCPYCAEEIQAAAIKCRYCGSRVDGRMTDPSAWHRGYPEARIAGVCAAIAHNTGVSVTAVRVGFLLLTLLHGFGLVLYGILWLLLPDGPEGSSPLERVADALRTIVHGSPGPRPPAGPGPGPDPGPGDGTSSHREDGASGAWSPTRS